MLTDDLVQFLQSGVSMVLASCDGNRRPVVGRGLACRIDEAGNVRLVVRTGSNPDLLSAIARGGGLAATFTRPSDHRSIQLKASFARTAATDPQDGAAAARQTAALRANLIEDGYWEAFAAQYCAFEPDGLTVIEFVPERAFVQTPGPGAGSPLHP
ncbi:MAG TPA: hypothetical protein VFK86_10515 [Bauldia sp.]|nr:hypothetical protein [Bauldia sp.]